MLDKNGQLQLLEAAHADPAKRELLWELLQYEPADSQISRLLSAALRTGQPQLAAELLPSRDPSMAREAEQLGLLESLSPQSSMVVPLRTRNRPLGLIMLVAAESGRRFEPRDLALAQDLVDRAALAVDSAQHYAAERQAHIAAGRAADRVTGLQEITAALAAALTPAEVAKVIVDQGMRVLGANAGALVLLSADAQHLQIVRAVGFPAELIEAWQQFPVDAPLPVVDAVRSGAPVWLESRAAWLARYPQIAHNSSLRAPRARSAIPLRVDDHVIGALSFNFVDEREFTPEDQAYMLTLAGQCAQALERARLYEAERQARSAAEQALQLRDIFFSVAAHELKTPLTSLIGHAQLLQRRAYQEANLSERDQRSVDVICGQASRLSQMVSALLDITRIEQGRLSIAPAPLNLVLLARRVVDEMRPTLDLHTLEYSDEGEPLIVIGDALRLEQVLQNLIGNAVKYSPSGGPIHVHLMRREDMAAVAVRDLGIGVPQAALSQLFQRFYRADKVDERQITGMGIGLYVVKEIITLHGGTVAVESTEGQGSTFTFYVPMHPGTDRR
jgi:signal transduction histidine kinase